MKKKSILFASLIVLYFVMLAGITLKVSADYYGGMVEVRLTVPYDAVFNANHIKTGTANPVEGKEGVYYTNITMGVDEHVGVFFWRKGSIIYVKPSDGKEVEALIDEFEHDEEKGEYRMKVVFSSGDVKPGDTVEVHVRQEEYRARGSALPHSAVQKDSKGYYVYEVTRDKGAWGYEYQTKKAYVTVLTSDAENVCLLKYECNYPLVEAITPEVTEGVFLKFSPEQAKEVEEELKMQATTTDTSSEAPSSTAENSVSSESANEEVTETTAGETTETTSKTEIETTVETTSKPGN